MNNYEQNALMKHGFTCSLVERGVDPDIAEFCVKQAEYQNLGSLSPEDFYEGFAEALEKKASKLMFFDDGGDSRDFYRQNPMYGVPMPAAMQPEDEDDDDEEESLVDKIKRWALYAGIGAGGFALGNYWPDIKQYTDNTLTSLKDKYDAAADRVNAMKVPDIRGRSSSSDKQSGNSGN